MFGFFFFNNFRVVLILSIYFCSQKLKMYYIISGSTSSKPYKVVSENILEYVLVHHIIL